MGQKGRITADVDGVNDGTCARADRAVLSHFACLSVGVDDVVASTSFNFVNLRRLAARASVGIARFDRSVRRRPRSLIFRRPLYDERG